MSLPDVELAGAAARSRRRHRDRVRLGRVPRCAAQDRARRGALAAAAAQSAASASAISIATSCIVCSRGIEGLEIPATDRRDARAIVAVCAVARSPADIAAELAFPDHRAAARIACRRRACQGRRSRRAWRAISRERPEQEFFVSRFVDYSERGRPVSQIPHRLRRWPALCLPHGDRRSLGHLVSQRRHVAEREQASRRRNLHARLRRRLRAPPRGRACRHRRRGSAWIISRSIARKPERRIVADVRGRQYRRSSTTWIRPNCFPTSRRRCARYSMRSRRCSIAARRNSRSVPHDRRPAPASRCNRNRARRSIRRTGTRSARRVIACSTTCSTMPPTSASGRCGRRSRMTFARGFAPAFRGSRPRSARSIASSPISSCPMRPAMFIPASWDGCMAAAPPSACWRRCWRPASTPISAAAITCRSRSSARSSNGCARCSAFRTGRAGFSSPAPRWPI